VLRQALLQMSKSDRVRHLVETAPVSRSVVARYVAGAATEDGVRAAGELVGTGRLVTLDHLGEDTLDLRQAQATT
jgi:proline dehydrogenase